MTKKDNWKMLAARAAPKTAPSGSIDDETAQSGNIDDADATVEPPATKRRAVTAESADSAVLAGSASSSLPAEELNQPAGYTQSLSSWDIVREPGGGFFVERIDDRNCRFKSPDGGQFVEGVSHPPFIRQPAWSCLREAMTQRPSDIWITTFPKCGTTMMEQIVLLLLNDGNASLLDPASKNALKNSEGIGKVWPEASVEVCSSLMPAGKGKGKGKISLLDFKALPSPRLLKTHAPRHLFLGVKGTSPASLADTGRPAPLAPGVKVIYVSRNAKDACVSAYYHAANPHRLGWPFDAWVKNWASGLFEHGRWSDHVAGWRTEFLHNPGQVLWIRYEDVVSSPEVEIRRVAAFLGLKVSDETIAATVHHSGFQEMKAQSGDAEHMRRGEVGDYKRHFSPALEQEFDELYQELMRGINDPYA